MVVQGHNYPAGLAAGWLFPCAAFPVSPRSTDCLIYELPVRKAKAMLEKKKRIDHDNTLATSALSRSYKCMPSNSIHRADFIF
jgi:hypothetical protein